jgi:hypothetical protein
MKPCSSGVRDLQEISGIGSKGMSSPGGGGQRRCSAGIHEGEGAAGGRRQRSGCGEWWGSSGAREEGSERSGDGGTSGAARAGSERLGGSATEGKGEEKGGGPGRGGAVGPSPDRRMTPGSGSSAALAGDVRRARACRPDRAGREASDGWAAAQCRVTVPLRGGAGLSTGAVESTGARGPAREESGVAEPR